jgi:hypothetical protein
MGGSPHILQFLRQKCRGLILLAGRIRFIISISVTPALPHKNLQYYKLTLS